MWTGGKDGRLPREAPRSRLTAARYTTVSITVVAYSEKIGNEWAKVVEDTSRYAKESA
ncbi:hypothetical protein Acr_28g0006390 [Actinidia rufa]|uniref:Uncharacterized protein n=1 Tax=Actinidia rufa TaxID=165716 RepID=A0A7J0HAZ1_9ERIC|nr:hypothetical protein Acr_28g0006390 [Actinidia rufa]